MSATDTIARRLMRKHQLAGIRLTVSDAGVTAEALPLPGSEIAVQRNREAFSRLSGYSADEAQKIVETGTREPIAAFTSTEIDLAILGLEKELKRK